MEEDDEDAVERVRNAGFRSGEISPPAEVSKSISAEIEASSVSEMR